MKIQTLVRCAAFAFLLSVSMAFADDLDKLAGKWSVKKTNDEGQSYTQTIEIKKDKLTFKITSTDGELRFVATGDLKAEKCGVFNVLKITGIQAGQTESDLSPVDDDRSLIYQISDDTWTVASNMDKERENQKPVIDVYKKAAP